MTLDADRLRDRLRLSAVDCARCAAISKEGRVTKNNVHEIMWAGSDEPLSTW